MKRIGSLGDTLSGLEPLSPCLLDNSYSSTVTLDPEKKVWVINPCRTVMTASFCVCGFSYPPSKTNAPGLHLFGTSSAGMIEVKRQVPSPGIQIEDRGNQLWKGGT